ncbi:MAG TPA: HDOD domain-containing protein [Spongiibacteraceae bacterium]|nr:HDOD domain-containing protein [Spongiibacteraceae bacterium]
MQNLTSAPDQTSIYISVVEQVLSSNGDNALPGLPKLALEIQRVLAQENATAKMVAATIRNEPGLTALLFKMAASALYRTAVPAKSLEAVIARLGLSSVANIVMLHSIRSMFIAKSPDLKKLYGIVWRRQVTKAGLACFLAAHFHLKVDELLIQSLMTEVGSLAVLMALKDYSATPNEAEFINICREYSKPLGVILLTKWGLDRQIVESIDKSGHWFESAPGPLNNQDVLNLSLYQTVLWTSDNSLLPSFESLALYPKLPESWRALDANGGLEVLAHHREKIDEIIDSLGGVS